MSILVHLADKFKFCHPGDRQQETWMLLFDDNDKGYNIYYNELEAKTAFERAEKLGWNCHLFSSVKRNPNEETV